MTANKFEPNEWWFKIRKLIYHLLARINYRKTNPFRLDLEPFETAFLFADFKRQRLTTVRRTPF